MVLTYGVRRLKQLQAELIIRADIVEEDPEASAFDFAIAPGGQVETTDTSAVPEITEVDVSVAVSVVIVVVLAEAVFVFVPVVVVIVVVVSTVAVEVTLVVTVEICR